MGILETELHLPVCLGVGACDYLLDVCCSASSRSADVLALKMWNRSCTRLCVNLHDVLCASWEPLAHKPTCLINRGRTVVVTK